MTEVPLTIAEAAAALRSGAITSAALTEAMIARADDLDPKLGTYITRMDVSARAQAAQADADFAAGIDKGPLQGIPLGVKDIIATKGAPTTSQSQILDPAWGENIDAPVVSRLKAAGAVITGKTTTMEFAVGLPDLDQGVFPTPRNPWDTDRWPGGSSSGTGNGIAGGLILGGLGTDTGGSIRGPAHFSGISGLKPTFGLVPKSGCTPVAYSLDNIGPMARSARDCAILLQVLAGYDASDLCSVDVPLPDYVASLTGSLAGLRVGVERAHHTQANDCLPDIVDRFEEAVAVFEQAGATVSEISIPRYDDIRATNWTTIRGEAFAYHKLDLQQRWKLYGVHTAHSVGLGALSPGYDFVQAQRLREWGRKAIAALMADYDILIMPTDRMEAPLLTDTGAEAHTSWPSYRGIWNAVGFPALSVPMGFTARGLPVGLQIVAKPFEDAVALSAGDAYQRLTDWHLRVPPIAARVPAMAG